MEPKGKQPSGPISPSWWERVAGLPATNTASDLPIRQVQWQVLSKEGLLSGKTLQMHLLQ